MEESKIIVGMSREVKNVVTDENTAKAMGSGSLEVYATPSMVALMEKAAATLLEDALEDEFTSVGTALNIAHTSATPRNLEVRAKAEITEVNGRKVSFSVTAWDEVGKIGSGSHERFIVLRKEFALKAEGKLTVKDFG